MAPQTRSRNRPSISGPASKPKSKPKPKSAPAKVYKSTPAAPKQVTFPERRRRIKTYSRNRKVRKDSQQNTLTQLGISIEGPSRELQESEKEDEGDDQAEEPEEPEEPEAPAPVEPVNPKKRTRSSRRKTAGDELLVNEKPKNAKRRKTLGDPPTPSASSSFHTQTLTQLYANQDNEKENEEDRLNVSEPEDDAGFVMETPKKSKDGSSSKIDEGNPEPQAEVKSSVRSLVLSATPTNRKLKAVVASSVSTASTVSTLSSPRINEFNPAPEDSPLRTRSTNLGAPSPIIKKVKTPRNQEIPNSYSTTHSLPTTPTPKTAKKTRFDDVETIIEEKENITPGNTKPKFPKPVRKTPARPALKTITPGEIADSDEETIGDDDENGGVESEGITNQAPIVEPQNAPTDPQNDDIPSTDDPEPAETCYGAIGDETQAILNTSADELCLDLSTSDSRPSSVSREGTPTPRQNEKRREVSRVAEVISSPNTVVGKSPSPSPQAQEDPSDANIHTQVYTQGLESQRLPLEVIRNLGPQTPHSDILMSLHPEPLEQILSQTKTHEFRSWKIPPSVRRVWIYATKPIQELKYTVILGDAKRPGEIPDEGGIGNVEFNQGNGADYAYEIVQVYELNNPVSLVEMKQKGWCKSAPQKFAWLPPAVVGELTGNLKCALFGEEPTESQAIVAQFHSDAEYSTQHILSEVAEDVIPSSQSPRRSARKSTQPGPSSSFAKPALPSQLQHESSTQSLRRTRSYVRPSQATTVSSPAVSPQKSLRNTVSISSDPVASNSSPPAFRNSRDNSLRSSQFLTRSQMLPDSLINDPIQPPPAIIWDSADEMSD